MQVMRVARDNGFIRENDDEQVIHRVEDLYVYTFDDLCMIIDTERIDVPERAELITAAADDSSSIYRGVPAAISDAGNGYKVALLEAKATGFSSDDGYRQVSLRGFQASFACTRGHRVVSLMILRSSDPNRGARLILRRFDGVCRMQRYPLRGAPRLETNANLTGLVRMEPAVRPR